jgi:Domain of unknown function (DUF4123)
MPLYYLLDAARMLFAIDEAKQRNPTHDSLYRGQSEETLAVIAPYLFQGEANDEFDNWLTENAGQSWGVGIESDETMAVLHKHFRKFLLIQTDDGEEMYFRFYDPRVLRNFLPTCTTDQIQRFFGPVRRFIVEDPPHEQVLTFWHEGGTLQTNTASRIFPVVLY